MFTVILNNNFYSRSLGVSQLVIAVNKLDTVDWKEISHAFYNTLIDNQRPFVVWKYKIFEKNNLLHRMLSSCLKFQIKVFRLGRHLHRLGPERYMNQYCQWYI